MDPNRQRIPLFVLISIFAIALSSGCIFSKNVDVGELVTQIDQVWIAHSIKTPVQEFPYSVLSAPGDQGITSESLAAVKADLQNIKISLSEYAENPERSFALEWINFNLSWVNVHELELTVREKLLAQESTALSAIESLTENSFDCTRAELFPENDLLNLLAQTSETSNAYYALQSQQAVFVTQLNFPKTALNISALEAMAQQTIELNSYYRNTCTFSEKLTNWQMQFDELTQAENTCTSQVDIEGLQFKLQELMDLASTLRTQATSVKSQFNTVGTLVPHLVSDFLADAQELYSALGYVNASCG